MAETSPGTHFPVCGVLPNTGGSHASQGKDEWRASNAVIWLVDNVFRFAYLYAVQGQVRAHGMRERSGEEEGIYVRVRVQYFFISVREGGKVIHLHAAS